MDAESENKRAKLAQAELNMVQEFLDQERSRLFEQFAGTTACEDLHEIHTQARSLTNLENFLLSLVQTGKLNANKEFNQ